MPDMEYIKYDFRLRFRKLATDVGIRVVDDRILKYPLPFSDDTILASWISKDLRKVMRVQESDYDDGTFQFDGFVGKSGLDYEYDDLCVIAVASNEKAKEIFDLYKLWFIENISPEKMERILESHFERFNKS